MKKIIFTFFALLTPYIVNAINIADISGTWVNDSIEITFTDDTLIIDEIGIEGDTYTYTIIGDYIIYQSEIDKVYDVANTIQIIYLDETKLNIKYDGNDNIYTFNIKD